MPPVVRSLTAAANLALTVAAAALPTGATAATCRDTCGAAAAATLAQDCGACATPVVTDRVVCLYKAQIRYSSCVGDCPAFAGRCAITRDCVNRCRAAITGVKENCESVFRAHLRQRCANGRACLAAARRTRRQCVRQCSPGATAAPADRCDCQPRCIEGLVGDCFADCDDRCGGDTTALSICRRGCRDASCAALTNACTTERARPHDEYQRCCAACGNCQTTVDCETTTSSTTTTTSTTSTPGTTSTTLPACATIGATCGSCGSGLCVQHCAVGGAVCIVANSTTTVCTSDATCSATFPVCGGLATDPVSCSDQGFGYCAAACP